MTASKFSAELTSIVTDKLQIAPDEPISVSVLLEDDAIFEKVTSELEMRGMRIKNITEGPDVLVTGIIAVEKINKLNEISEVERIEYIRSS